MGNIKRRLAELEKDKGDDSIQVTICWCEPGKCTCPPADIVVSYEDDDMLAGGDHEQDNQKQD